MPRHKENYIRRCNIVLQIVDEGFHTSGEIIREFNKRERRPLGVRMLNYYVDYLVGERKVTKKIVRIEGGGRTSNIQLLGGKS